VGSNAPGAKIMLRQLRSQRTMKTIMWAMAAAFVVGWLVSLMTKEQRAEDLFEDEKIRTYLGIGAE